MFRLCFIVLDLVIDVLWYRLIAQNRQVWLRLGQRIFIISASVILPVSTESQGTIITPSFDLLLHRHLFKVVFSPYS